MIPQDSEIRMEYKQVEAIEYRSRHNKYSYCIRTEMANFELDSIKYAGPLA